MSNPLNKDIPIGLEELFELIKEPINTIEKRFKKLIYSDNPIIQEMIDYVFAQAGKRLRPALVFISSMIWKSDYYNKIIDIALSIELIHIATLVHDDVIDRSDLRRGIETYNKKWGSSTASVLFGDFLFSRAFMILTSLGNFKIIENLTRTTSEICEGEIMQSLLKESYDITVERYLNIIRYKTASLIAESCRIGVIYSNFGKDMENILYQFGLNLGMAFQIYDDYLDFNAKQEVLGKPILNDLDNGYITLPIIHLLNRTDNGQRGQIINKLNNYLLAKEYHKVRDLLNESNSLKYTLDTANNHVSKAVSYLDKVKDYELKMYLTEVAGYITARAY